MANAFPLVSRELDDPIAYLSKELGNFGLEKGVVTIEQFLSHVHFVAEHLGDEKYAINLCANRYLFLVGFCAAIVRGQVNLLPPNQNVITQTQLNNDYGSCCIIYDGCEIDQSIDSVDLSVLDGSSSLHGSKSEIPSIFDGQLACISFTSGSTGKSKPNLKHWRTLHKSTAINYQHMIPLTNHTLYQLATVPPQHMWGLETSILMPLFSKVCMCDAKPLFPQDIVNTLRMLPSPRMLVSTPVHLRAFAALASEPVSISVILCATSPLGQTLAAQLESLFSATLNEVYGCSEVGSMALKRTSCEDTWKRFDGIDFEHKQGKTIASASHLPDAIELQDNIEVLSKNQFTLAGRATDLVKIAGKRGSLFEINQTLLNYDGVEDGVVVNPVDHQVHAASSSTAVSRLNAIVVLKSGVDKTMLRQYLQQHVDHAFVPRPIYVVDSLPRESNGKLLKDRVVALLKQLKVKQLKA